MPEERTRCADPVCRSDGAASLQPSAMLCRLRFAWQRFAWQRFAWLAAVVAGVLAGIGSAPARAQSTDLSGQVVNGITGAGVPRALVTIGGRSVLTDSEGHFELPGYTGTQANAMVRKPGYTASLDALAPINRLITNLDAPIELKLYPDGVITGTVTDREGTPLPRVAVSLTRAFYDTTGLRSQAAGISMTDSHGRYRFREVPGRYRISLRYAARLPDSDVAVLPAHFPDGSASRDDGFFVLGSGEERSVDLHAATSVTHVVRLRMDADGQNGGVQVVAINQAGDSFFVPVQMGGDEIRIDLPSGTYQLKASRQNRDQSFEGSVKVTVANADVAGMTLRMAPVASLPVEWVTEISPVQASLNPAATPSGGQNTLQEAGLYLHPVSEQIEGFAQDIRPMPAGEGAFAFRVPAGRYRLGAQSFGQWHVISASCGMTNLLTDELAIGGGSAGTPVRIVLTNAVGTINGTALDPSVSPMQTQTSTTGSGISPGWVYLFPQFASLVPFMQIRIASTGAWNAYVLPGTYTAVALREAIAADLREPAIAARYTRLGKSIEVTDGGKESLSLDLTDLPKETP